MATTAVPATIKKRPSTRRASLTNTPGLPEFSAPPSVAREDAAAGSGAPPVATGKNMARTQAAEDGQK